MLDKNHLSVKRLLIVSIVVGGLIVISLLIATQPTLAQEGMWNQAVMISSKEFSSWFPDIATDQAGGVHVFWASGRSNPNYNTVVYCQVVKAKCAETVEVMALKVVEGSYNTRPVGVVDEKGIIHMLWHGPGIIYQATAPVVKAKWPASWSSSERISGSNTSYYMTIVLDKNGVLHVAWSENVFQGSELDPCYGCSEIFYRYSKDLGRTWSAPIDISNTKSGSQKPQLVLGPNNHVYLVWEEGYDSNIGRGEPMATMFVASPDGGQTWGKPTTFGFPGDTPQSITAGVDSQGKIVVVWRQVIGNGVFYQVSSDEGESWSPPKSIPGVLGRTIYSHLDGYDMAADSVGHLHLVMVGTDPTLVEPKEDINSVYHLEWDGQSWSRPTPIVTVKNDLPEWPRIAVSNGNKLNVVWFVRDAAAIFDSQRQQYRVWYAQGTSSAPAEASIDWPTPTPTPTRAIIATQTPVSTPTSIPTTAPTLSPELKNMDVAPEAISSIYTDMDEIFVLTLSLVPAGLVIAVVMISVRLWRRS